MAFKIDHFCISIFLVVCITWQAYGQSTVDCTQTGPGRFPNPTDSTCQNYTYCVFVATTNTYVSFDYVCPTTSVFNPTSRQCTAPTNYVCTVQAAVCTADGFIPDPSVSDCSAYIECVNIGGVFSQTTYTCPANTFYDPTTTLCESTYVCTTTTTTVAPTTTFTCSTVGRFANTTDTTCQSYHYCVLATNGTLVQYDYTCPTTSVFNPASALCTTAYTCPT